MNITYNTEMQAKILTLYELNHIIRNVIETDFPETLLITAEIASLREDQKGHCYLELIERDETTVIASMRATVWSYNYKTISRSFELLTGTPLSKGIKILFEAYVSFHERYGLSLNIQNIDPSYTLGEMMRKRKEILERLSQEGLLTRNKELMFPPLPLKLAVISSSNAAGYEDFINHIKYNPFGYPFKLTLFNALMQGDNAETSILDALNRCRKEQDLFDIVIIIRGGGGVSDLHCFDSYEIGKAIASMPLPVISGIGHERDRTVVDKITHTSVKTPTAAAEVILQAVRDFDLKIQDSQNRLAHSVRTTLSTNTSNLHHFSRDMEKHMARFLTIEEARLRSFIQSLTFTKKIIVAGRERMDDLQKRCVSFVNHRMKDQIRNIEHARALLKTHLKMFMSNLNSSFNNLNNNIKLLDPRNVLKRGYSITYKDGEILKNIQNVVPGDIIRTVLYQGKITSSVAEVKGNDKEKTAEI